MEEWDINCLSDRLDMLEKLNRKYSSIPSCPPKTVAPSQPTPKKEPPKISMSIDRELSDDDWKLIQKLDPALAMQMLRQRFQWKNMSAPTRWLRENCSGFYHVAGGQRVLFELEEDAMLFKMSFEGKS